MNIDRNLDDQRVVDGMSAQGRRRADLLAGGARSVGWKAGLGTAAAMEKAGTGAPVAGFLTDATRVADGGSAALDGWSAPTFEPELAIRVDFDVAADASLEDVAAAVGAIAPAIELVDLEPPDDLAAVLAGNVFHRAYLVGAWTPATAADVATTRLDVTIDGQQRAAEIDPAAALGDLVAVIRSIAAQASLAGAGLRAGELVITGSAIPAIALAGGQTLTVALTGSGRAVTART
ncbi:MAG: 2-oxo-3-hexenedioate decarboxylase [Solirubrobacteraceae bacterium]|jgi:2-oxo-3-hexenedioate decarboxylase|nr:2-oxo-3-hexenedioate decarboxylase [Solirubrobacteraceae bacterium]